MTKQIRNTVRAAQLLQTLGGTGGNPLDALLSFLEPVLSDFSGYMFEPHAFADAVRDAYGWDFNEDVADGMRPTFRARGWLRQKRSEPSNLPVYIEGKPVEIVTYEADPNRAFDPEESIDAALDRIVRAFHAFLFEIDIDASNFDRSDDSIIDSLVSWLLDNGTSPTDIEDYTPSDDRDSDDDQTNYLIARFVQQVNESNAELSLHLRNIAAVGLLSELAQDFHKPLTAVKRSNLTVFLDSPVALDLLGASGSETAELTRSIISKLQTIGASVAIFAASVREMQSILDALLLAEPQDRFGPSQEAIRRGEIDISFLSSIRHDPDNAFKPFRVKVHSTGSDRALRPDHYFTEGNFGHLYDKLLSTQANQRDKEKRCRHDAQATAMTMRLRKGHEHPDIFETRFIFLTRNRMFSTLTRNFCIKSELLEESCVGPMINMHDLAASLWLRTGLHNEVDVPRRQLLVGCQRVLALKRPVVVQAQRAILRLKESKTLSDEKLKQMEAILATDRSLTLISDRVRGAREKLNDDTLIDVARTVMANERHKGLLSGLTQNAAETAELAKALDDSRGQGIKLQTELSAVTESLGEMRLAEKRRVQRIVVRFNDWHAKIRFRIRLALGCAAAALFSLALIKELRFTSGIASVPSGWLGWTIFGGALITIAITFADQVSRLIGGERPIDRFLVDPWARSKLRSMIDVAGLTMPDIMACAIPPSVPVEPVTLDDFGDDSDSADGRPVPETLIDHVDAESV